MDVCVICGKRAEHQGRIRKVTVSLCSLPFSAYRCGYINKEKLRNLALLKLIKR